MTKICLIAITVMINWSWWQQQISVTITSVASPGQRYWWAECSTEHWVVLIFLVIFVWSQIDMIILYWLFYLYNESDIDFFDVVNANFKISDWFHKSEIAFWISVSTFQEGRPVLGQLKIGPTSQEPGDNHRCNIFSPFNIFNTSIYLIYSVYSIYWRWAPQDKNLLTSNQFFQNIDEFELACLLSLP